jgi:hypothetical protein
MLCRRAFAWPVAASKCTLVLGASSATPYVAAPFDDGIADRTYAAVCSMSYYVDENKLLTLGCPLLLHVLVLAGSGKAAVLHLLLEAAGEVGPVHSPNAPHTR